MFDNNFLEDEIYGACDEYPRDFTEEEMAYIQNHEAVQKILLEWFENDLSVDCWTQKNREFMKSFLREKEDACFLGLLRSADSFKGNGTIRFPFYYGK